METWWEFGEGTGYSGDELAVYRLRCAFCRATGNFSLTHREKKIHAANHRKVLYFDTMQCGECANYLMVFWSAGRGLHDYKTVPWAFGNYESIPENWPDNVGRFWQQGRRALARNDLDAATLMTRSALQAALRAKDADGGTLQKEIDNLASTGLLPPLMKDWAHALRLLGNSSAHPKPDEPAPDKRDVRDVVEFLE